MFCSLGEERNRFRQEKRKKKNRKKLITAGIELVGMKRYIKRYYHVKYFLPNLSRFLMRRFLSQTFEF